MWTIAAFTLTLGGSSLIYGPASAVREEHHEALWATSRGAAAVGLSSALFMVEYTLRTGQPAAGILVLTAVLLAAMIVVRFSVERAPTMPTTMEWMERPRAAAPAPKERKRRPR